jgi:rhodanese-related sulfurtransferase
VFFCAYGERSAMSVVAANQAGLTNAAHISGGIQGWIKAGGPIVKTDR